jgi:hypothetical protein
MDNNTTKQIKVQGKVFTVTQVRQVGAKYVVSEPGAEFGFASVFTLADCKRVAEEYLAAIQLKTEAEAKATELAKADADHAAEAAQYDNPLNLLFS